MRSSFFLTLAIILHSSLAFPDPNKDPRECPFAKVRRNSQSHKIAVFDAAKQKVDVSGIHIFQPPGPKDLRGPCPGLNALANHGYLPRSGLVTFDQAIQACNSVYGMGVDVATTLATLGVVVTGNLETDEFSIGGSPGGEVRPPFISLPQGLSGSHNKYETDASPGRGDYYLHNGDASILDLNNFKLLYKLQPEEGDSNYNLSVLIQHRKQTFDFSIKNNPHFYHGPLTGTVLSNGAHAFIPALMSNHSAQFPEGILPRDVLKSFFGVQGTGNNLTYQLGYERIPDSWFRRPIDDDYGSANLNSDIAAMLSVVPETISVGGNTGAVNTFTVVNISSLTGGTYDYETLLQDNNLGCFG
ncbi:peroxidase family 2 domain protein [Ceratobasidium sp. AG-Ba]|nr:peroxidase family 2 domain protein [Ceratobasidium sp. AG-Ba]